VTATYTLAETSLQVARRIGQTDSRFSHALQTVDEGEKPARTAINIFKAKHDRILYKARQQQDIQNKTLTGYSTRAWTRYPNQDRDKTSIVIEDGVDIRVSSITGAKTWVMATPMPRTVMGLDKRDTRNNLRRGCYTLALFCIADTTSRYQPLITFLGPFFAEILLVMSNSYG
jgi:hypothetical protein